MKMTLLKTKKIRYILVALFVIAVLILVSLSFQHVQNNKKLVKVNNELNTANKYVLNNNNSQALAHAREALDRDPDNLDAINSVASLTQKNDPAEAKQLYSHELDVMKKQNDPDMSGKNAITYWAAAGLAEKAGETVQAKKYYQKVIEVANPKDGYEQSLSAQSRDVLRSLR